MPVGTDQCDQKTVHTKLLSELLTLFVDALIGLADDSHAHFLNDLDDDDHEEHAEPGDVAVAALVTVDDGDLTETGAADGAPLKIFLFSLSLPM